MLPFPLYGGCRRIGQRKDLCQPGSDHAHRHAGEHQDGGYFHHEDCRQPVYRQHCPYKTVLWKRLHTGGRLQGQRATGHADAYR